MSLLVDLRTIHRHLQCDKRPQLDSVWTKSAQHHIAWGVCVQSGGLDPLVSGRGYTKSTYMKSTVVKVPLLLSIEGRGSQTFASSGEGNSHLWTLTSKVAATTESVDLCLLDPSNGQQTASCSAHTSNLTLNFLQYIVFYIIMFDLKAKHKCVYWSKSKVQITKNYSSVFNTTAGNKTREGVGNCSERREISVADMRKCRLIHPHTHTQTHRHTHNWCTPLRPSCGWKKSSPCEPHRVSYVPLTAEQIYHNTVRTHQPLEPWWFPHSGSPSGALEGHRGPVALVLLPAAHSACLGLRSLKRAP